MLPVQPKKYGRYVVLAAFTVFAFKNPVAAAALCNQAGVLLGHAADALAQFVQAL